MTTYGDIRWNIQQHLQLNRGKIARHPVSATVTIQQLGGGVWIVTVVGDRPIVVHACIYAGPTARTEQLRLTAQRWLYSTCSEKGLIPDRFFHSTTLGFAGKNLVRMETSGTFRCDN